MDSFDRSKPTETGVYGQYGKLLKPGKLRNAEQDGQIHEEQQQRLALIETTELLDADIGSYVVESSKNVHVGEKRPRDEIGNPDLGNKKQILPVDPNGGSPARYSVSPERRKKYCFYAETIHGGDIQLAFELWQL